jgi:hypothetical protein
MSGRIKIVSDDLPPLIAVLEEALKVWGMGGNTPRANKQYPLLGARKGNLTGLSSPVSFVAVIYCTCERIKERTEAITSPWLAAPVFECRSRATHHWAHKLR